MYKVVKEFTFYDDNLKGTVRFYKGDVISVEVDSETNKMFIKFDNITYVGTAFDVLEYVENVNSHVQLKYGSVEDVNCFLRTIPKENFISITKVKRNRYLLVYIDKE